MCPATAISPAGSSGWSQGTTVTVAPRLHRHRIWLFFRPQSRAVTRSDPPGLNTRGAWGRGADPQTAAGTSPRSEGLHSPSAAPRPLRAPATPSATPPAPGASCWGPRRRGSPRGSQPAPASPAASPSHGSSWSAPAYPPLQVGCETQSRGPGPPCRTLCPGSSITPKCQQSQISGGQFQRDGSGFRTCRPIAPTPHPTLLPPQSHLPAQGCSAPSATGPGSALRSSGWGSLSTRPPPARPHGSCWTQTTAGTEGGQGRAEGHQPIETPWNTDTISTAQDQPSQCRAVTCRGSSHTYHGEAEP